jgi:hypothetical protein
MALGAVMRIISVVALSVLATLLAACTAPTATIKTGELEGDEARTYLIYADQLERVRNIWKHPVPVCLAMKDWMHQSDWQTTMIMPTWPDVVERLKRENETAAVKLQIDSSPDCLAKYVKVEGGPASVMPREGALIFAEGRDSDYASGGCGHKYSGGMHAADFDRYVTYDIDDKNGVMTLNGGQVCVIGMYRI